MDDAPAFSPGDHRLRAMLGREHPGGGETQERRLPFLEVDLEDGAPVHGSGHVHHDVDGAEPYDRPGDGRSDVVLVRRVAPKGDGSAAPRCDKRGGIPGGGLIEVAYGDVGAFASHEIGDRPTEVRTGAEDDRDLPLQPSHRYLDFEILRRASWKGGRVSASATRCSSRARVRTVPSKTRCRCRHEP